MPPAQNVRVRPYKDLLVPVLHRRFFNFPDSILTLSAALVYAAALLMGNHASYAWMLVSSAGRAFLLYTPAFLIIMIRLVQMHFAEKSTPSGLDSLLYLIRKPDTYTTIIGYLVSGCLFSEIFIFTAGEEAGLGWVTEGHIYEKLRLNENVIYLRSHACIVALVQALIHLYHDYSVIRLPAPQSLLNVKEKRQKPTEKDLQKGPIELLKEQAPRLLLSCLVRAVIFLFIGPFLYLPIRPYTWNAALSFARNFMRWNIPPYSQYDSIPPFHYSILWKTFSQAMLLFTLWEMSNAIFSVYIAQEPVKNEYPLTDDYKKPKPVKTKDPNGSLLNGLKAKNYKANFFSMWELDIIARRFEERRTSILAELDRKDGCAWIQILNVCLGLVEGVSERINPADYPSVDVKKDVQYLPKITPGLREDSNIEVPRKTTNIYSGTAARIGSLGKSIGSAPSGSQPKIVPTLKNAIGTVRQELLTKEQQKALSREQMSSTFRSYAVWLLKQELWLPQSPITSRFQPLQFLHSTYARQIRSKVFGAPHSDFFTVVRAVDAISALVAVSVTEDKYGVVSKSLPQIWRTFVKAVNTIEGLEERTTPHWTDVNFDAKTKKDPQVELLLAHLKEGIHILLLNFGSVAGDLGLGAADVEGARKAIAT